MGAPAVPLPSAGEAVHDTLELFGGELEELRRIWREELRPGMPERTALTVERLAGERFMTVTDVIRTSARIPADRSIAPERIRAVCALGLQEIFGAR